MRPARTTAIAPQFSDDLYCRFFSSHPPKQRPSFSCHCPRTSSVWDLYVALSSLTLHSRQRIRPVTTNHRSRIRYLSKKNSRILTNFRNLKKFVKNSYKNSLNARADVAFQWNTLLICIISNKLTTTTEEFDAFHGFMLIKI